MTTTELDPDQIATEARETFSITEIGKQHKKLRPRTVTVYLDDEAGDLLGGTEPVVNQLGVAVDTRRWGVLGEIDRLRADNPGGKHDERILELLDEAEAHRMRLLASALKVTLRAVPDVIYKDTRRRARKELGIKGKNIPEELEEAYLRQQSAEALLALLQSITTASGANVTLPTTPEGALEFRDLLADPEWRKIDVAIGEIQFQTVVSEGAVADADF